MRYVKIMMDNVGHQMVLAEVRYQHPLIRMKLHAMERL